MIAFTSQMPHIVSNAFIKSPTANTHKGFSAGSYKDLTRVAWLNPQMWAELFMSNKTNILNELEIYIENLQKYKDAIEGGRAASFAREQIELTLGKPVLTPENALDFTQPILLDSTNDKALD
jgi:prephenate dehydrogenase